MANARVVRELWLAASLAIGGLHWAPALPGATVPDSEFRAHVAEKAASAVSILSADSSRELSVGDPRLDAIELVAFLRWEPAAEVLVELVQYADPIPHSSHTVAVIDDYPAAAALVAIGDPSVRYCLRRLRRAEGRERQILLVVVEWIKGRAGAKVAVQEYLRSVEGLEKEELRKLKSAMRWYR